MNYEINYFIPQFAEEKFELRNLSAGQLYHVAITAGNAVGFGEALKFAFRTASEHPNPQQSGMMIALS